jgi:hypothetical protein
VLIVDLIVALIVSAWGSSPTPARTACTARTTRTTRNVRAARTPFTDTARTAAVPFFQVATVVETSSGFADTSNLASAATSASSSAATSTYAAAAIASLAYNASAARPEVPPHRHEHLNLGIDKGLEF